MIKINITIDSTNWLEATWTEDDKQLHCESYSGHPEHITMLRAKALEFGTPLDEFEGLIAQAVQAPLTAMSLSTGVSTTGVDGAVVMCTIGSALFTQNTVPGVPGLLINAGYPILFGGCEL